MEWCRELALALQISLIVPFACGAFIGIAFQPENYYLFALSVMVRHQVDMVRRQTMLAAPAQRIRSADRAVRGGCGVMRRLRRGTAMSAAQVDVAALAVG